MRGRILPFSVCSEWHCNEAVAAAAAAFYTINTRFRSHRCNVCVAVIDAVHSNSNGSYLILRNEIYDKTFLVFALCVFDRIPAWRK